MAPDSIPLQFDIGQPVVRTEDKRLLSGGGQFTDDTTIDGQVYAKFVRSPIAHGVIKSIDTATAADLPLSLIHI